MNLGQLKAAVEDAIAFVGEDVAVERDDTLIPRELQEVEIGWKILRKHVDEDGNFLPGHPDPEVIFFLS